MDKKLIRQKAEADAILHFLGGDEEKATYAEALQAIADGKRNSITWWQVFDETLTDEDLAEAIESHADTLEQRYTEVYEGALSTIGDKGVREKEDGVQVIQGASRSDQLNGIIEDIYKMFDYVEGDNAWYNRQHSIDSKQARLLMRYMDQIGIISDELAKAGK